MTDKPKFEAHAWKWGMWFRILGRGLSISYDHPRHIYFSERYGYRDVWRIWRFKITRHEAWPKPLPSREITPYRVPHKDRYL